MRFLYGFLAALIFTSNAYASFFLLDGSVIQQKLAPRPTGTSVAAGGVAISGTVNFSTTSGSFVDVTGSTVTITTTGRPVYVFVTYDSAGGNSACTFTSTIATNTTFTCSVAIVRSTSTFISIKGTAAGLVSTGTGQTLRVPIVDPEVVDVSLAAGTYTYKLQAVASGGSTTSFAGVHLVAYEL